MKRDGRRRCHWAGRPPHTAYHDAEWGVPLRDARRLFELRIREVRQGPDGALYVFGGDSLIRITPR